MRIPHPVDLKIIFDKRLYQHVPAALTYPENHAQLESLRGLKVAGLRLAVALQYLITLPLVLGLLFDYENPFWLSVLFSGGSVFVLWVLWRQFKVREYLGWFDIAMRLAKMKDDLDYTLEKMRD